MARIVLIVTNNYDLDVECTDIKCQKFDDLKVGTVIPAGGVGIFESSTNDRVFCTFEQVRPGAGFWQLGMTCPKSSSNSAQGSFRAGLQKYRRRGTPVTFEYVLGQPNRADWDNGRQDKGENVPYGHCS